jgi:transcription antitermination factor NusG
MKAWFALHTKPSAEIRVARALMNRGFTVFLPLLPGPANGPARPLFPAYLFMECDLSTVGVDQIQWIPGLRRILSFDGRPAVVPESAVALIRTELTRIEAAGGLPSHGFQPGDTVVIDSGPLAGLRGVFQGPVGPTERVHILLRFLGQINRTEVPVEVLRPAPEEGGAHEMRRGTRGRGRRVRYPEPR